MYNRESRSWRRANRRPETARFVDQQESQAPILLLVRGWHLDLQWRRDWFAPEAIATAGDGSDSERLSAWPARASLTWATGTLALVPRGCVSTTRQATSENLVRWRMVYSLQRDTGVVSSRRPASPPNGKRKSDIAVPWRNG